MSRTLVPIVTLASLLWATALVPATRAHDQPGATQVGPAQASVVVVTPPPANVQLVAPSAERLPPPDETGSVLKYGLEGFLGGSLAGLSTGYLVLHDESRPELWRGYLLASGIGALSGAGMGLVLGLFDAAAPARPARYVMRDAAYGTLLGSILGATVGGLVALSSRHGEDALLGGAIGGVSGFGLGALIGALEGQRRPRHPLRAGLGTATDIRGRQAVGIALSSRF